MGMNRAFNLLAILFSVTNFFLAPVVVVAHQGTEVGGPNFSEKDLEWYLEWGSEHGENRNDWPEVLAIGADVWVAATYNNIYGAKDQALWGCRRSSASPSSCKIVDVNRQSEFIKKFKSPSGSVQEASTVANRTLKECFDLFHFGPSTGASVSWEEYVTFDNHIILNRGECDAYVSDDYAQWIGPILEDDRLNAGNRYRTYPPFDVEKVAKVTVAVATTAESSVQHTDWGWCVGDNLIEPYRSDWLNCSDLGRSFYPTREEAIASMGKSHQKVAPDSETPANNNLSQIQSSEVVASQPTEADKNIELEFWQSIKESNDPDMYREYLRQFPSGVYAGLAKLKIKKLGGDTTVANTSIPNLDYGDYYALVIGNNEYQDLTNLRSAVNDAKVVSTVLEVDYGFNVKLLENASRKDILRSLKELRQSVGPKDNVLIYYAGHGYLDKAADQGYWLPVDSERDDDSNWIPTDRVAGQVKAMKAKHVMVVADSCFSGTITRAIKIEQRTPEWLSEIVKKKARTALTSGGLEPVLDTGSGNHSAFAYAFISLLEENDGVLDASQLFSQLRPKVMVNSTQTPQYGKIHMAGDDGGDFLFVRQ